ncbi:glycosyltransferase family 39 protein [Thalassospiraceae bacterium LMO-SO8]|nr:glycosyltransferase family 39 protein [Alphaproteobacteria bacterium LMO-S08]WND77757.1 glycosyltransferase family 39 protein [Thalassospiraceae bacterium LMO-SO8]
MSAAAKKAPRLGRRLLINPTLGWKPYALLTLFCCILFLPGIASLPPLDRDEARFAQATAQMLETGDFVDIRFQDQPRHKKPAGIHWLQAASVTLLSDVAAREIWAYRVPSVIGAWAAVLLTFALGCLLFDRRAAFTAAAMLAASTLLILEAHQAKTDAVLLACVLALMLPLARHYLAARRGKDETAGIGWSLLFWLALAAGILIKGPIAPLIAALTLATLAVADRDARWIKGLGWLWGLPLMLVLALPWFLMVGDKGDGGDGFVMTAITTDLIPKLLGGQESHGAPPGYYVLTMLLFFWPGVFLAWPALFRAWKERTDPALRFCLAWLLPAWILMEIIPTKLPHYVLPLYPALALICARSAMAILDGKAPWYDKRALWLTGGLWALVGLTLGGAAAYLPLHFGLDPTWRTWFFALFAVYLLATTAAAMKHHVITEALENSLISGGILTAMVVWLMVAGFAPMWVAARAANAVAAEFKDGAVPVTAAAGFSEPSLVFLSGTKTILTSGGAAAQHLLNEPRAAAIIEGRELPAFTKALGDRAAEVREAARVSGINYSKGKPVTLHVFVRKVPAK